MGETTAITWADATWNPWMGCTKISAGCKNCYMFREQTRFGTDPLEIRKSKTTFKDPLKWKEPKTIFVCSWSDFFHEDVPPSWRQEALDIMYLTPHHTYLLLTKRPENIHKLILDDVWRVNPNIWLGVTAENQEMADERIPALMQIPAAKRFVSAEPLLGQIRIDQNWFEYSPEDSAGHIYNAYRPGIHWVIVGGESGKDFRPMKEEWALDIRDQCVEAGIPFFFKQWDGVRPKDDPRGDLLDGHTWHETPTREEIA